MDRLTGTLLLLHDRARRRSVTAEEIAAHYEVSRRTMLRDVQALCEMGVPVIAQEGAGGGYRLPANYDLKPLPLSTNEALLMLLALSTVEKLADAPYAPERASLQAKLRSLLTSRQEHEVRQRLTALSFDVPERRFAAPHLETLLAAAQEQSWLLVAYRSAQRLSTQHLLPRRLTASGGFWYCSAYSLEHREERQYRADRFISAQRCESPARYVPEPAGRNYEDPAFPEVVVRLTEKGVLRAEREPDLGHRIEPCGDDAGGGIWRFRCPASEYDWLARYLLGFGGDAVTIAPDLLRQSIAELATIIAGAHTP